AGRGHGQRRSPGVAESDAPGEHARPVQEVAELLASRGGHMLPERAQPIPPAALFVLTRAVIGVLRAAFEERSSLLGTPELEDELAALVEAALDRLRMAPS